MDEEGGGKLRRKICAQNIALRTRKTVTEATGTEEATESVRGKAMFESHCPEEHQHLKEETGERHCKGR